MLSVAEDKQTFAKVIRNDLYIKNLGFPKKYVYTTMTTPDLIKRGNKQIFIYNAIAQRTASAIEVGLVYQIDVSAPTEESYIADMCMEQIQALLIGKQVRHRTIQLFEAQRALPPSVENFYVTGMKIVVYSTIFNKKLII